MDDKLPTGRIFVGPLKKPFLPLHFFVGAFEKDSYQWNSDGPHP